MLTVMKFTGLRLVHHLSIILDTSSVLVFSKSCGDRFIGDGDRLRMELGVPSLWPARMAALVRWSLKPGTGTADFFGSFQSD